MIILSIDPGSKKTGLAILDQNQLHEKKIIPTTKISTSLMDTIQTFQIQTIVIGNGTNSKSVYSELKSTLKNAQIDIPITIIDEKYTTEMGRIRYWKYHPPKGLKKWLPLSWQTPPAPIDDFVAWIIGEIFFGTPMPEKLPYLNKKD